LKKKNEKRAMDILDELKDESLPELTPINRNRFNFDDFNRKLMSRNSENEQYELNIEV
jgi:hypothetical protein